MSINIGSTDISSVYVGATEASEVWLGSTLAWSRKAAVVKAATADTGATVTLPAHAAGDLLVVAFANLNSSSTPTEPAGSGTVPTWTRAFTANDAASAMSYRVVWAVATTNAHTGGNWTSGSTSNGWVAATISDPSATPVGGNAHTFNGSTAITSHPVPAITLANSTGTSALLQFLFHLSASTTPVTWPAGYTARTTTGQRSALASKNITTTDGALNVTTNPARASLTIQMEIRSA